MTSELYTRAEISRMTEDALDELLGYYQDKGNTEGALRVQDELGAREDDREAELAHEIEEADAQRRHDEMINDMMIESGRWG
jgi:hypothetical protein